MELTQDIIDDIEAGIISESIEDLEIGNHVYDNMVVKVLDIMGEAGFARKYIAEKTVDDVKSFKILGDDSGWIVNDK